MYISNKKPPFTHVFTDLQNDIENGWTIQVIYPEDSSSTLLSEKDIVLALDHDKDLVQVDDSDTPQFVNVGALANAEQTLSVQVEKVQESEEKIQIIQAEVFSCPNCLKTYNAKRNLQRHLRLECGKEPQYGCKFCGYKNYRRNELLNHVKKRHGIEMLMMDSYTRRDQEIAWRRQQYQRPVPKRMAPVYQSKRDNAKLLGARRALNNAAPIKRPSENKTEYKSILKPQVLKPATVETPSVLKPSIKVEIRKASSIPKASPRQGCGLLTDRLSCIFTRRNNQQRKVPQKRVFYEDVPQSEPPKEKENELSDTESTYLPETKPVFVTPQKDCPEPPRISQPTPDISMEDWFTTKQRILGNVKHEENVCEPLKISETKCPEPPHIEVDPHGFDIEPPAHINKNVSPYVPTNSYERDEYEKYKSEKFKKEIALALLQKHFEKAQEAKKQREEAENVQKQSTVVDTHYSQIASYVPTQQQYEEDQDMEKYQVDRETYYEQPSYQPTSLQEQTQQYVGVEYYGRYDTYDNQGNQVTEEHNYAPQDSKLDTENCPEAPQISSMPQEESPPEPPVISEKPDDNPQYYQGYTKYDETNTFKEPIAQPVRASNQTMCHKCSFQTTNPKKLRDHLKFVHGEVVAVENTAKPKELFSRRDPKIQEAQEELFSRRGDFPSSQETEKKNRFKRRNTSAMVNIISSDIVVPARSETENRGEATYEAGDASVETHETGVLAAMEYFETTKDQPKKPRPYKRDPDQLDNDWI